MEYPLPLSLVLLLTAVVFPHYDWSSCIPVYHIVGQPILSARDFIPVKPELSRGNYAQNFEVVSSKKIVWIITLSPTSWKWSCLYQSWTQKLPKTACDIISEIFLWAITVSLLLPRNPMTTRNLGTHRKISHRYSNQIALPKIMCTLNKMSGTEKFPPGTTEG